MFNETKTRQSDSVQWIKQQAALTCFQSMKRTWVHVQLKKQLCVFNEKRKRRCFVFNDLFIYVLLAYSAVNRSRSPQGFSQIQISHTNWIEYKTCTLHTRKTYKHNPKGSPFGIALVNKWQIKIDAGTIDHVGLAFQYQVYNNIQRNGQKQLQIKNTV